LVAVHQYRVLKDLLETAELRNSQIESYVEAGDKPRFDLVDNTRSVLKRRSDLIKAENEIQQTQFELSLFYRDESGEPILVEPSRAASDLAAPPKTTLRDSVQELVDRAVKARPELEALRLQLAQTRVDLKVAENQLLPDLGVNVEGSKDIGNGARKQLDQGELIVAFKLEVPLQMRKQKGKRDSLTAQLGELTRLKSYMEDKVATEVNKAVVKMEVARQRIQLAESELAAARELEEGERVRFSGGDSNLVFVNLREQTAAEAAITRITSLAEYQVAYANFKAALGESN
jgi:outer membrane protein TolC